jgi:hypothetical protein
MLHMFAGFETAKIPDETAKKNPTKRRKKSRSQNVKTEAAKKTGNGDILGNRRQLLLFRISSDNFA